MGNNQVNPSELIQQRRKQLVEGLKNDPGILLDGLMARGILTVSEYESLDAMNDPERMVRRVLLIVQNKGMFACQELLKCAAEIHPYDSNDPYWNWKLTPERHGYHYQRNHDSCCADNHIEISGGSTSIWVPNPADEDAADGVEQSMVPEAAELDTLEDQESSKDPESESQTPEDNEVVNEVLEQPEPQTPENDDLPEWCEEPEPECEEVVEDCDEDS